MHAVINHLRVSGPPGDGAIRSLQDEAIPAARKIDGCLGVHLVQLADDHLVMIVLADRPETLQRISSEVGSPWVGTHLAPLFTAPPERAVGAVLGSSEL